MKRIMEIIIIKVKKLFQYDDSFDEKIKELENKINQLKKIII